MFRTSLKKSLLSVLVLALVLASTGITPGGISAAQAADAYEQETADIDAVELEADHPVQTDAPTGESDTQLADADQPAGSDQAAGADQPTAADQPAEPAQAAEPAQPADADQSADTDQSAGSEQPADADRPKSDKQRESDNPTVLPLASKGRAEEERIAAQQQEPGGVIVSVPTKFENNSSYQVFLPVFHYRPQGTETWISVNVDTDTAGHFRFYVDAQKITADTTYEYVTTYRLANSSSNTSFQLCKLIGTFQRDASGQWAHVNNNQENVTTQRAVDDRDGYSFMIENSSRIKSLVYSGRAFWFYPSVPGTNVYMSATDPFDGTPVPVSYGGRFSAAVHAIVKGGPSQPIGVYKAVTTDGSATDGAGISYRDLAYPYRIDVPDYLNASGTYYPLLASDGSYDAKNGGSVVVEGNTHTMTHTGLGVPGRWDIGLKYAVPGITIQNLLENTEITLIEGDQGSFEYNPSPSGMVLQFRNLPPGENKVVVELSAEGLFTVPLRLTIDADTATLKLTNMDEIAELTSSATYDEPKGLLTLTQVIKMDMERENGEVFAKSPSIFKSISNNRLVPGVPATRQFRVYNGSGTASYKVTDYYMSPQYTRLSTRSVIRALPNGDSAIDKYMQKYNPDELAKTPMRYVYDFEGVNGESLYDGLLRYYRELPGDPYPGLEKLEDLPATVIGQEIFTGPHPYYTLSQVDTANENVTQTSTNAYVVWEYDPKMIDLANHLLYEHALYISFDSSPDAYPWSSSNAAESYGAYRDRTPENKAMMDDIIRGVPAMAPGNYAAFDNFSFGVSGTLINNPYLFSRYNFGFDFRLLLSVVGVEGVAFEDVNANGVYDSGIDRLLPGTRVQLFRDGESGLTAETTTDEHGRYEFASVPHGSSYYLSVETPAGMELIQKGTSKVSSHFDPGSSKTETFLVEKDEAYRYNAGFVAKQDSWTVTYHGNGASGTVVDGNSPYSGGTATVLPHDHTHAGAPVSTGFEWADRSFTSWNTAADGSGTRYLPGDKVTMNQNYLLYAQWEIEGAETLCRVDFDSNGGSPAFESYEGLRHDSRIDSPGEPSRDGYVFQGWYLGEEKWDFNTDTVKQDITLVAHWKPREEPSTPLPEPGDNTPPPCPKPGCDAPPPCPKPGCNAPTPCPKPGCNAPTALPKTGDSSSPWLFALLGTTLAAAAVLLVRKIRRSD
ncbi:MAG: InlB B-repeat-containing protein [Coriobacteriales bacterium]|nr:InlB B-repeat-containing protein [Coriobacteriales bacterium]